MSSVMGYEQLCGSSVCLTSTQQASLVPDVTGLLLHFPRIPGDSRHIIQCTIRKCHT